MVFSVHASFFSYESEPHKGGGPLSYEREDTYIKNAIYFLPTHGKHIKIRKIFFWFFIIICCCSPLSDLGSIKRKIRFS